MKRRFVSFLLILISLSLTACNLPARAISSNEAPTPTETTLRSSATPGRVIATPSDTPAPSATPSPTPTEDLTPASMRSAEDLICRFGPGRRYGVGGSLNGDEDVLITARNGPGDWYQFELAGYPGKYCWVFAADVELSGNLRALPIAEAPLSFVTNVSVLLDPLMFEPATCIFPLTFTVTFSIETIGPTFVTFQRSQSTGLSAPPETVEFTEAGAMVFEDYLRADSAGEHWFRVAVSSPNSVVGQGIGTVVCP